jgi:hypothetical protein
MTPPAFLRQGFFLALLLLLSAAARADTTYRVGYQILHLPAGTDVALWYPTAAPEQDYAYGLVVHGSAAFAAAPLAGQRFPLVVFSHGLGGGATQSVFFTETLARHGYVVAAPNHHDAVFHLGGMTLPSGGFLDGAAGAKFFEPQNWTPASYADRRDDVEHVLDYLLATPPYRDAIDPARIGGAGHSLGGYTIAALAGCWRQWHDPRLKAALLFSPYIDPFLVQQRLGFLRVPVMYQGAEWDLGITPTLGRAGGAYDSSNAPKYFLRLRTGSHLVWSNALGRGRNVADTLAQKPEARLIDDYGIAFLDRYLKGLDRPILTQPNPDLAIYRHDP